MNRTLRTVLPALAALLAGTAAAAQTVPSSYRYIEKTRSLTAYLGYIDTSPTLALPDSQSAELGPQSTPVVGVRYAMRVGGPVSLEAHLAFAPAERRLYQGTLSPDTTRILVTPTGDEVSEPLLLGELAMRFHLTGDRTFRGFAPFVLASGGVVAGLGGTSEAEEDIPEHRRFDFGPTFAVGAGTGLDYFVSQQLSLRAELTYRLWRLKAPGGLLPSASGKINEWSANRGISVGAAYHF